MSLPIILVFHFVEDGDVVQVSKLADDPVFNCCFDRAFGLVAMATVSKFAAM
jgi:hypothetical protein